MRICEGFGHQKQETVNRRGRGKGKPGLTDWSGDRSSQNGLQNKKKVQEFEKDTRVLRQSLQVPDGDRGIEAMGSSNSLPEINTTRHKRIKENKNGSKRKFCKQC